MCGPYPVNGEHENCLIPVDGPDKSSDSSDPALYRKKRETVHLVRGEQIFVYFSLYLYLQSKWCAEKSIKLKIFPYSFLLNTEITFVIHTSRVLFVEHRLIYCVFSLIHRQSYSIVDLIELCHCAMLRHLLGGICTTANLLLNRASNNAPTNQTTTSKWRVLRDILLAMISAVGIPLVQSLTASETVYELVNASLANATAAQTSPARRQRDERGVSDMSRPNFRRRTQHSHRGVVRIVKPTINIHIH